MLLTHVQQNAAKTAQQEFVDGACTEQVVHRLGFPLRKPPLDNTAENSAGAQSSKRRQRLWASSTLPWLAVFFDELAYDIDVVLPRVGLKDSSQNEACGRLCKPERSPHRKRAKEASSGRLQRSHMVEKRQMVSARCKRHAVPHSSVAD